ncbi:hypothetical protein HDU93_001935 [Gonapodya sp. JEL0774]|nr:hypothetical protein HDU93_001935 [Gonapodya sp. JEL0774]
MKATPAARPNIGAGRPSSAVEILGTGASARSIGAIRARMDGAAANEASAGGKRVEIRGKTGTLTRTAIGMARERDKPGVKEKSGLVDGSARENSMKNHTATTRSNPYRSSAPAVTERKLFVKIAAPLKPSSAPSSLIASHRSSPTGRTLPRTTTLPSASKARNTERLLVGQSTVLTSISDHGRAVPTVQARDPLRRAPEEGTSAPLASATRRDVANAQIDRTRDPAISSSAAENTVSSGLSLRIKGATTSNPSATLEPRVRLEASSLEETLPNPPSAVLPPTTTPSPLPKPRTPLLATEIKPGPHPSSTANAPLASTSRTIHPVFKSSLNPTEPRLISSLSLLLQSLGAPLTPSMRRDPRLAQDPSMRCDVGEWGVSRVFTLLSSTPPYPTHSQVASDDPSTRLIARAKALTSNLALLGVYASSTSRSTTASATQLPPFASSSSTFYVTLYRLLSLVSLLTASSKPPQDDDVLFRTVVTRTTLDGLFAEKKELLCGGMKVEVERRRMVSGVERPSSTPEGDVVDMVENLRRELLERRVTCEGWEREITNLKSKLSSAAVAALHAQNPTQPLDSTLAAIPLYLLPTPIPAHSHPTMTSARLCTDASARLSKSLASFFAAHNRHLCAPSRRLLALRPPLAAEDECARELGEAIGTAWTRWQNLEKVLDALAGLRECVEGVNEEVRKARLPELEKKIGSQKVMQVQRRAAGMKRLVNRVAKDSPVAKLG